MAAITSLNAVGRALENTRFPPLMPSPVWDNFHNSFDVVRTLGETVAIANSFFESTTWFVPGIKSFEKAMCDKAEPLGSYQWTLPIEASIEDIICLLELSTDAEAADRAFVDFYSADGHAEYGSLKTRLLSQPTLQHWREEIISACERFEAADYLSSVNNLLPVLEGFAAQVFCEPRFHTKRARERFFNQKLSSMNDSLLVQALWRSIKTFVDRLFERADFDDPLNERLNRHARVHGRGHYKLRSCDCLRLLQALQTIAFVNE